MRARAVQQKSAGYLTERERDATGMQDIEAHLHDQHNVVSEEESDCIWCCSEFDATPVAGIC